MSIPFIIMANQTFELFKSTDIAHKRFAVKQFERSVMKDIYY